MDFSNFNNDDENTTDEEYFAFIDWLSELTASELRAARGNPEAQRQALCRYYRRGYRANINTGELVDFLGISDNSILDMADYDDEEADAAMQLSAELSDDEIGP